MSEPAWKRLGLKIKETVENDPLGITKVNVIKKRKAEPGPNTEKKPPKRKKLPKNERPPPPEKDQLKYLRQYHEDRANWKFSKAKQTWILKNLKNIPQEYDEALKAYIASIQGGSRDRVRDEMMAVVDKWNNAARQALEDMQKEPESAEESQEEKDEKDENAEANDDTKEKEEKKGAVDEDIPEYDFVMRAKALVEIITGEQVSVEGMAEESVKEGDKQDSDGQKDAEREHPMIVEEVDVQEYVGDEDEQLEVNVKSEGTVAVEEAKEKQKTSKKTKKEKKAKKEKKDKSKEQA
ncbi:hypothetical protein KL921_004882 [Ogataea angusta]|uniref:WKF domain-containing protein n=1 Tax=Pichia angusta TaxID=870730 RepID=A0ABQ7RSA9_PICAN|nr:hypothetical protein KL921_004882 [Ogataea angusta]KAG7836779.1 hypothetical protein KL942_004697 [Ogataea angusta]KAG7846471.1 hypothetical protein KL940_004423 [Ogataea angusta]